MQKKSWSENETEVRKVRELGELFREIERRMKIWENNFREEKDLEVKTLQEIESFSGQK